jgi:hypothetical protein
MAANDIQHGGAHYKSKAIQPWDYIVSNNLDYLQGNIVKYVSRFRDKNGLEDLYKAQHYIEKLIETEKAKLEQEKQDNPIPDMEKYEGHIEALDHESFAKKMQELIDNAVKSSFTGWMNQPIKTFTINTPIDNLPQS